MVKNLALPRARSLGYFLTGLSNLKAQLGSSSIYQKLTQAQSRLITTSLARRPEFDDPYGTRADAQIIAYLNVIKSIRADVDQELILRLLPGTYRRAHGTMSINAA